MPVQMTLEGMKRIEKALIRKTKGLSCFFFFFEEIRFLTARFCVLCENSFGAVHEFLLQAVDVSRFGLVVGKFAELNCKLLKVDISPSTEGEGLYDLSIRVRVTKVPTADKAKDTVVVVVVVVDFIIRHWRESE